MQQLARALFFWQRCRVLGLTGYPGCQGIILIFMVMQSLAAMVDVSLCIAMRMTAIYQTRLPEAKMAVSMYPLSCFAIIHYPL